MNKKMMLPALLAVSAMMLAVPAMASALVPLHINPKPTNPTTITSTTESKLSTTGGTTLGCKGLHGSATWTSTTGGTLSLTFKECKTIAPIGGITCENEPTGNIITTTLPFHLATLPNGSPGVLITSAANEHFAEFKCSFLNFTVTGNGVVGTIESACESTVNSTGIVFEATKHGEQKHPKVAGTETVYHLKSNGTTAAQEGTANIHFPQETKLECT